MRRGDGDGGRRQKEEDDDEEEEEEDFQDLVSVEMKEEEDSLKRLYVA